MLWDNAVMQANSHYQTICVGKPAFEVLNNNTIARLHGYTSKGWFLISPDKHILLISHIPYRGPLTINIDRPLTKFHAKVENVTLRLTPTAINQDDNVLIHIPENVSVWRPSMIPLPQSPTESLSHRYRHLLDYFNIKKSTGTISEEWMGKVSTLPPLEAIISLKKLLGNGPGLTPSGDDFITGFLLIRSIMSAERAHDIEKQIQLLEKQATKKTTALSANLIKYAATGQADERLINCAHWLLVGTGDPYRIKKELLSYGSSSGLDALAGMLSALQHFNQHGFHLGTNP